MGYCVDAGQMTPTDKLQMMTSRQSPTSQSHKRIAQTNRTKQDDAMSRNANDNQCFRMLQSTSGAYGGPETGNLTEIHPSQSGQHFMAPC